MIVNTHNKQVHSDNLICAIKTIITIEGVGSSMINHS